MKRLNYFNPLIFSLIIMLATGCQKEYDYAILVDGETFNRLIPAAATAVVFECNSSQKGECILSSTGNTAPIYGHLDGTVWHVTTSASTINANPRCGKMFCNRSKLSSIVFDSCFNTTNVTDMHEMFRGCNKLTSLNVSNFNTANVERMDAMFYGCSSLTSLDVSNFNTSNVTTMTRAVDSVIYTNNPDGHPFPHHNEYILFGMFTGCSSLTRLDLSSFNTSKVTDMRGLFEGCKNLTSLNVTSFNTANVEHMDAMFKGCSSLTSIDLSNFNTSNVVSMGYKVKVFRNGGSWGQRPGSGFDWNGGMFMDCRSLTSLNLSNFNTSNVTNMCKLFYNCTHLTFLDLSQFDMELCDLKEDMCSGLSTSSGACTIICTEPVQNSLLELYHYYAQNEDEEDFSYYYTGIPADEVTFTWLRP